MTSRPELSPAKANRDLADELLAQAREALARERVVYDEGRVRELGRQIEATRQRGRDDPQLDNRERLRDLGREHHRMTGTGGGAT